MLVSSLRANIIIIEDVEMIIGVIIGPFVKFMVSIADWYLYQQIKTILTLSCLEYPLEDVPLASLAECTFKAANDGDKVRM